LTLERQARPRTARVKRQRKNKSANNKLAATVDTVGAFPNIIVMELPNVNIPKTVNHPSIVFAPPSRRRRRPSFILSLFALDESSRRMAQASHNSQGKWNASAKPKTTHEKEAAKSPKPAILTLQE
jgi:hypothetical protein